ncbi:MAG TPA: Xaa-Pro aminopeptidase [Gammaproteobacteria bacterium]|nr:Xaa-Pro aminopeptidase [Gammaproteobacteria bacterium]
MKIDRFDFDELQQFKAAQATAYDVVRTVAREMTAGMTELQVAARIGAELERRGVRDMFHQPFAWFGDRTAFRNFGPDTDFLPTDRCLEKGMPVILDVAPIQDGYACDIGYTTSLGRNGDVEAMQKVLMECRDFILAGARARKPFRQIYRELDGLIARHGFVNVHRIYPERVLAHRVFRFGGSRAQQFLQRFRVLGFGLPTYVWLLGRAALARLVPGLQSPLWNDGPECAHAPLPGVWAVEPHIATPDYRAGAKWEEMLVITETDAYWLDDDVPHCRQARRKGWWSGSAVNARNDVVAEAA